MGDIQSADSHSPTSRDTLDVDHLADELLDQMDSALSGVALEPLAPSASALGAQMRSNTMAHVCWHRNCSIGINEYKAAFAVSCSRAIARFRVPSPHKYSSARLRNAFVSIPPPIPLHRPALADTFCGNSKIARAGRSFGSYSLIFASSSTNHIRYAMLRRRIL